MVYVLRGIHFIEDQFRARPLRVHTAGCPKHGFRASHRCHTRRHAQRIICQSASPPLLILSSWSSPECGDMKAGCVCVPAGPAEPGLHGPSALKAGGLWDVMLGLEELGKLFSQPADTRNCASGVRSDGACGEHVGRMNSTVAGTTHQMKRVVTVGWKRCYVPNCYF